MWAWLKAVSETESSQRGESCSMFMQAIKNICWRNIQEQLKRRVLLVALNKNKKKENRLAKLLCLLIGPVAMVTGWHHVIINRCLIRLTVHGKVLIKACRALVRTSAGQWLVASYGLLSMFTRWQMDRRQTTCYPAGVRVRGQREGGQGGNDTDHCNCRACLLPPLWRSCFQGLFVCLFVVKMSNTALQVSVKSGKKGHEPRKNAVFLDMLWLQWILMDHSYFCSKLYCFGHARGMSWHTSGFCKSYLWESMFSVSVG